jgi:transcriptional regulator with XRE-family HTH domain
VNRVSDGFIMVDRTKPLGMTELGDDEENLERDEEAFRAKLASIARANREAAGLSPAEAARRAQISRAAVRDVEGQKGWPRVDTLVAYARAIGTTPWALLRRAEPEAAVDSEPEPDAGHAGHAAHAEARPVAPVDLNAILLEAGAGEQTWRVAKALLEALVAAEP